MNVFGSDGRAWVTVIAGVAVVALNLLFLFGGYAAVMRRRTGRRVPEGNVRIWSRRLYTAGEVFQYMADAGPDGRHVYRLQLWWDMVYAVLFGLAGFVLMDGVFGRAYGVDRWWLWALDVSPVFAGAADALEDAALLVATRARPAGEEPGRADPRAVVDAERFTRAKFLLHAVWIAALVVGAAELIRG